MNSHLRDDTKSTCNSYFLPSHSGINIFHQELSVLIVEASIQRRYKKISEHRSETETEKTYIFKKICFYSEI